MSDTIQTPEQGTEQEQVTPQADPEMETSETPIEEPANNEPAELQQPAQPQAPDYKQQFVDSQREAILLNERLNQEKARNESLTKQDTPTDEAMRKLCPEWDQLEPFTKNVLIRQETEAMKNARLQVEQAELKARLKLDDELEDVIENSEFAPKLKGKESAFKRFAKQKKNTGIPADVLAKALLFEPDETPAPTPNPEPMPTEALPTGSGGPRGPIKPKKIPIEEAANIRKTDYKRYVELVKAGAIEDIE